MKIQMDENCLREREYLLSMKETDLFKELEEVLEGKRIFRSDE